MEFSEKVKETAAKAGRTVNAWADCAAAHLDVLTLESSRDKLFAELGRLFYHDPSLTATDPRVVRLTAHLKEICAKIDAKKEAIASAKGKIPCSHCGRPLPADYAFCPHCGRPCEK
ncbi:MAG: zinc ribbon domain-containing protein [Clostridia bacterium]|nr:zinc ribbon domain-containing protein [Clostridia bacterium]